MSEPLTDEDLNSIQRNLFFDRAVYPNKVDIVMIIEELRAHRAWRAKLGDPDTWFPSTSDAAHERRYHDCCDDADMNETYIVELLEDIKRLVERAKEGP